ncbi:hypothetical protein R5W24_004324, partial [Gemmata sp. JC717]|uniref:hypothetical protein n=1 Tax=Gemmata algarum TaxID=2975278 RepID=UPI0021BB0E48
MRDVGVAIICLMWIAAPLQAQETAEDVLNKAVSAHGGAENLRKSQSHKAKISAKYYQGDKATAHSIDCITRLPGYDCAIISTEGDSSVIKCIYNNGESVIECNGKAILISESQQREKRMSVSI